jgi:hypothetical protein
VGSLSKYRQVGFDVPSSGPGAVLPARLSTITVDLAGETPTPSGIPHLCSSTVQGQKHGMAGAGGLPIRVGVCLNFDDPVRFLCLALTQ